MRVLHVLEATLGGTRRYVEDIANANLGCQMGLAYSLERADPQFSQTLSRIREMGWSTYEIPMMREINWRADLASLAAFRRISESFKPTVIHGHSSKAGAICRIVPRTRQSKARVVYSPHAIASDLGVVYRVAERVLALRTERFVAVSASERQQLLALGLADGSRIDVASPVVDGSEFLARDKGLARRVLDLNGSLTLVSVGRLSDQKNPLEFFNIAYGLRKYYPSLCAIWVGDGELRGRLESRIAETESEAWFRIAGWKVDTRDYIASADLVLSTSRYESFGYATAEALSMERLVVASDVTGTRDVMSGPLSRLLYPLGDIAGAIRICRQVIEGSLNCEDLRKVGRESVVGRFSGAALKERLLTSYTLASKSDTRHKLAKRA